jgi:hypothetical protein
MRKEDHQGIVPLYVGMVRSGKEDVVHMVSDDEVSKIR